MKGSINQLKIKSLSASLAVETTSVCICIILTIAEVQVVGFSNGVTKFRERLAPSPNGVLASDSVNQHRICIDAIAIYDSMDKAPTYLVINKLFSVIAPFSIVFFVVEPALALLNYGLLFYIYYMMSWKAVKNLVVKMELLPNTEEIVYQKVSIWGKLVTKKVKISDIEFLSFSDYFGEKDPTGRSVRGLLNRDVAFRIKSSNEILLFDKNGIQNQEEINHQILV